MKSRLLSGLLALSALTHPALADKANDTLEAAFAQDVELLDSYQASGREALVLARLLYDGLISKDHETGEFVPELATSFEFASDTQIDFEIREGVKFHNGETMTPQDVVYTLNRVSSPEYGARYAVAVEWIEKAEILDNGKVRVTMKYPFPMALEMLAGNLPIYPEAYYEEAGPEGMAVKPIGTGPYQLTDITPGVSFEFKRFEDYYDGGQKADPAIGTLRFRVLPEVNTQYAELMNGDLDWIWRVAQDDVDRLDSRPGIKVESYPIMRFAYIGLNPARPDSPLADVRVRQAVNLAIDREGIRDALVGTNFGITDAACNPVQFGCTTEVEGYGYDAEAAKRLLEEAGYAEGFELSMLVVGGASSVSQAEAMKQNLAAVGVTANIESLQYATAVDQWRSNEKDMFFSTWGSYGIGDVGLSVANFFSGSADDPVQDPEVIEKIKEATSIVDRPRRAQLYKEALQRIAEQAYWVPLWTFSVNTAMSEDLNLKVDPDEFVPFWDATWN